MRMWRRIIAILVLFVLPLWSPTAVHAQQSPEPLTVGLFVNPPFVISADGRYTGMAVELWEELAAKLHHQYRYVEFQTLHDLVEATASGAVDVAVTNLTINHSRAERVDFTQPWFDGGMRIMTNTGQGKGFSNLIAGLSDAGFLEAYAWIALTIVAATAFLTFFDRRFDPSFPTKWREGFAESFYTVMSVATSGKPPTRKNLFGWLGRIWQGLWLICGIAVLAYVTSSVTSVMTTLSLTNQIDGPGDLSGKTVGVMSGTVQEEFAKSKGLRILSYPGLDNAVQGLVNGDVSAIIHDAPVLEYYEHTRPEQPVSVVGRLFEKDKYGLALPRQSALTRPLTVSLLSVIEAGGINKLRAKYFGSPE